MSRTVVSDEYILLQWSTSLLQRMYSICFRTSACIELSFRLTNQVVFIFYYNSLCAKIVDVSAKYALESSYSFSVVVCTQNHCLTLQNSVVVGVRI